VKKGCGVVSSNVRQASPVPGIFYGLAAECPGMFPGCTCCSEHKKDSDEKLSSDKKQTLSCAVSWQKIVVSLVSRKRLRHTRLTYLSQSGMNRTMTHPWIALPTTH